MIYHFVKMALGVVSLASIASNRAPLPSPPQFNNPRIAYPAKPEINDSASTMQSSKGAFRKKPLHAYDMRAQRTRDLLACRAQNSSQLPENKISSSQKSTSVAKNHSYFEPIKDDANSLNFAASRVAFNEYKATLPGLKDERFPLGVIHRARAGLYSLTNLKSGLMYVGESLDLEQRIKHHRAMLRRGVHVCTSLQNDVNNYGIDAFEVAIIASGVEYEDDIFRKTKEVELLARLRPEETYNTLNNNRNRTLGRPVIIPTHHTREGKVIQGGIFESMSKASEVTGIRRQVIKKRVDSIKYPQWKDLPQVNA